VRVQGAPVEPDLLRTVGPGDGARPARGDPREGLPVDRGARSLAGVTAAERRAAGREAPDLRISEPHLRRLKDLRPILDQIARMGHPRVIIAAAGEGEALATVVVHKSRGTLGVAAVKAPGFGDRRKEMLQDMACE
jgi:chaperonin GroEL